MERSPTGTKTLISPILYWEYGFGIENIGLGNFRFIRVDFVWRNDFNDVNGVRNPKFGVRIGIVPSF